jgi:phosphoribosylformylglycinamidine synthase
MADDRTDRGINPRENALRLAEGIAVEDARAAIGGVGVLENAAQAVGLAMPAKGDLVLIGDTQGWLGQSLWLREILGREEGAPPPVDLVAERRNGDFVRGRILAGEVLASHDCADGGLLVALAEMAMGSGTGAKLAAAP